MARTSLYALTRLVSTLVLVVALGTAPGPAAAGLVLTDPHTTFEDAYQGATVEHTFVFRNSGSKPVTITETVNVRGTATLSAPRTPIAPGAEARVRVQQRLGDHLGRSSFRYAVITDEPDVERYRFSLSGFVQSAYDPEVLLFDFGWVDRSLGASASLELFSREVDSLRVEFAGAPPEPFSIQSDARVGAASEGVVLRATLAPGARSGLLSGSFILRSNVSHQPEIPVRFVANVFGDVVPSENPIQLGLARAGEPLHKEIVLRSRSATLFEVLEIIDSSSALAIELVPCAGAESGPSACYRLSLTAPTGEARDFHGELQVSVRGSSETFRLDYYGKVVPANTEIRRLVIGEEFSPAPGGGAR